MSDEVKGWRAIPPSLVIALVAWIGFMAYRVAYICGKSGDMPWSPELGLAAEGFSMIGYSLAFVGTLELARQSAGRLALAAKIAVAGFALGLGLELVSTLLSFDLDIWQKDWVRRTVQYGYWASWVTVGCGFAWAAWDDHRALAIVGFAVAVLGDPPPFLSEPIFNSLNLGYKSYFAVDGALRIIRTATVLALAVVVSRGVTPTDRPGGAEGLRLAARGMWLRVIVACLIVLLSVMAMGSRGGGEGLLKMMRFVMMAGACATMLAFAMFGLGIARTAGAAIADLPRYPLALSAACSMWCCGLELSRLPYVYQMLYKGGEARYYGDTTILTVFSTTEPLVAIAAVALVAIAIGRFASERTTIALQSEAQGKGIGIVVMMVASLAIQNWMIPKVAEKGSRDTAMVLMILAAGAALIAVVMIAKLCASAAAEIEREPGLPTASIVPPG